MFSPVKKTTVYLNVEHINYKAIRISCNCHMLISGNCHARI